MVVTETVDRRRTTTSTSSAGSQEDDESRSAPVPGVVAVQQGPNAGGASTSLRSSDLSVLQLCQFKEQCEPSWAWRRLRKKPMVRLPLRRGGQNPDLPIALPAEVVVSEATSSSNNPIYMAEPMALTEPSTNEQQQHKAPFSKYMVALVVLGAFLVIAVAVGVAVGVTAAMDFSTPLPPSPAPVFMARPNSGPTTTTTTGLTATDPPLSSLNCLCWYNQQQIL